MAGWYFRNGTKLGGNPNSFNGISGGASGLSCGLLAFFGGVCGISLDCCLSNDSFCCDWGLFGCSSCCIGAPPCNWFWNNLN